MPTQTVPYSFFDFSKEGSDPPRRLFSKNTHGVDYQLFKILEDKGLIAGDQLGKVAAAWVDKNLSNQAEVQQAVDIINEALQEIDLGSEVDLESAVQGINNLLQTPQTGQAIPEKLSSELLKVQKVLQTALLYDDPDERGQFLASYLEQKREEKISEASSDTNFKQKISEAVLRKDLIDQVEYSLSQTLGQEFIRVKSSSLSSADHNFIRYYSGIVAEEFADKYASQYALEATQRYYQSPNADTLQKIYESTEKRSQTDFVYDPQVGLSRQNPAHSELYRIINTAAERWAREAPTSDTRLALSPNQLAGLTFDVLRQTLPINVIHEVTITHNDKPLMFDGRVGIKISSVGIDPDTGKVGRAKPIIAFPLANERELETEAYRRITSNLKSEGYDSDALIQRSGDMLRRFVRNPSGILPSILFSGYYKLSQDLYLADAQWKRSLDELKDPVRFRRLLEKKVWETFAKTAGKELGLWEVSHRDVRRYNWEKGRMEVEKRKPVYVFKPWKMVYNTLTGRYLAEWRASARDAEIQGKLDQLIKSGYYSLTEQGGRERQRLEERGAKNPLAELDWEKHLTQGQAFQTYKGALEGFRKATTKAEKDGYQNWLKTEGRKVLQAKAVKDWLADKKTWALVLRRRKTNDNDLAPATLISWVAGVASRLVWGLAKGALRNANVALGNPAGRFGEAILRKAPLLERLKPVLDISSRFGPLLLRGLPTGLGMGILGYVFTGGNLQIAGLLTSAGYLGRYGIGYGGFAYLMSGNPYLAFGTAVAGRGLAFLQDFAANPNNLRWAHEQLLIGKGLEKALAWALLKPLKALGLIRFNPSLGVLGRTESLLKLPFKGPVMANLLGFGLGWSPLTTLLWTFGSGMGEWLLGTYLPFKLNSLPSTSLLGRLSKFLRPVGWGVKTGGIVGGILGGFGGLGTLLGLEGPLAFAVGTLAGIASGGFLHWLLEKGLVGRIFTPYLRLWAITGSPWPGHWSDIKNWWREGQLFDFPSPDRWLTEGYGALEAKLGAIGFLRGFLSELAGQVIKVYLEGKVTLGSFIRPLWEGVKGFFYFDPINRLLRAITGPLWTKSFWVDAYKNIAGNSNLPRAAGWAKSSLANINFGWVRTFWNWAGANLPTIRIALVGFGTSIAAAFTAWWAGLAAWLASLAIWATLASILVTVLSGVVILLAVGSAVFTTFIVLDKLSDSHAVVVVSSTNPAYNCGGGRVDKRNESVDIEFRVRITNTNANGKNIALSNIRTRASLNNDALAGSEEDITPRFPGFNNTNQKVVIRAGSVVSYNSTEILHTMNGISLANDSAFVLSIELDGLKDVNEEGFANPNATGFRATGSCTIYIGDYIADVPQLFPAVGGMSQGPWGSFSHANTGAVDIPAGRNTPVFSTHEGIARYIDGSSMGYGKHVMIIGGSYITLYAHLNSAHPRIEAAGSQGIRVLSGCLIGRIDSTGTLTTGDHLHYEIRKANNTHFTNTEADRREFLGLLPSRYNDGRGNFVNAGGTFGLVNDWNQNCLGGAY